MKTPTIPRQTGKQIYAQNQIMRMMIAKRDYLVALHYMIPLSAEYLITAINTFTFFKSNGEDKGITVTIDHPLMLSFY